MYRELPAKPNLEHLKNQAKELLHACQQGEAAAKERFAALSASSASLLKLADALHVVARAYGFPTWPKLKEHVESLTRVLSPAQQLTAAIRANDAVRTARVLDSHPELKTHLNEPLADYGGGDTPLLAAVQYGNRATIDALLRAGADLHTRGDLWSGGLSVLDECGEGMADFLIERGAVMDAHAAARLGRLSELQKLVAANPEVVAALGAHGQTPLHFASSVEVAEYLLEHGAEIDAQDLQHESTPAQHMLRVLQGRHYPRDRKDVARYLVSRGCRTDILMAAALGDLALVQSHLECHPKCIRTCVAEEYFPSAMRASVGPYIPGFSDRARRRT